MESKSGSTPLVVIVGETASGKSALAMDLARRFDGEIIAADSRTVYRGMDIGTAKPTVADMHAVPHHLIDVVDPIQAFTAADFKKLALDAIDDISKRHKLPFLVGGTGLYIDSVIYNFVFRSAPDSSMREELQKLSIEELQSMLLKKNIALPENMRNPRHLIRSLETSGEASERSPLRDNTLILGLSIEREILRHKITRRVDLMVEEGFIEEVKRISEDYGWDAPALQAPGYRAFRKYLDGECTLEEAKALFVQNDMSLAKRQRTWFRRNKSIHWISKAEEAEDLITTLLNKVSIAKP